MQWTRISDAKHPKSSQSLGKWILLSSCQKIIIESLLSCVVSDESPSLCWPVRYRQGCRTSFGREGNTPRGLFLSFSAKPLPHWQISGQPPKGTDKVFRRVRSKGSGEVGEGSDQHWMGGGTPPKQWVVQVTDFWPRTKRRAEKKFPKIAKPSKMPKKLLQSTRSTLLAFLGWPRVTWGRTGPP